MATDKKTLRRSKIKQRVRKKTKGTPGKPRLSVFKSNRQIYAQIIDDVNGKTLTSGSSQNKEIAAQEGNKTAKAAMVGKIIAEQAKEAGIENIIFDRNGYRYHGRVKALAEAARKGGLKF